MAREDPTIYMRLPAELKSKLDRAAEEGRRSLTAEVVARLSASFEDRAPDAGGEWDLMVEERQNELNLEATRAELRAQRAYLHIVDARVAALAKSGPERSLQKAKDLRDQLAAEMAAMEARQNELLTISVMIARKLSANAQRRLNIIDKLLDVGLAAEVEATTRRQQEIWLAVRALGATQDDVERARAAEDRRRSEAERRMHSAFSGKWLGTDAPTFPISAEPAPTSKRVAKKTSM